MNYNLDLITRRKISERVTNLQYVSQTGRNKDTAERYSKEKEIKSGTYVHHLSLYNIQQEFERLRTQLEILCGEIKHLLELR
ncbi:unnamed protein product [Rhizophagus irregularis]|nr:unnamed protein product [Rhizophagus irregularis]CAB5299385.1 unnamed protein product [Rhizophagus irregularis]